MDNGHHLTPESLIGIFEAREEEDLRYLRTSIGVVDCGTEFNQVWWNFFSRGMWRWYCGQSPVAELRSVLAIENEWIEYWQRSAFAREVSRTEIVQSMLIEILVGEDDLYSRFPSLGDDFSFQGPDGIVKNYEYRLVKLLRGDLAIDTFQAYIKLHARKQKYLTPPFTAYVELVAAIRANDAELAECLAAKLTDDYLESLAEEAGMIFLKGPPTEPSGVAYNRYLVDFRLAAILKACGFACRNPAVKAWRW